MFTQTDPGSGIELTSSNKVEEHQAVLDDPVIPQLVSSQYKQLSEVHSELQQIASDDASSNQDVLVATSTAMTLVEDHINNLQMSASMPSHLQRIMENTLNQITKAKHYIHEVEKFVSIHYYPSETRTAHSRILKSSSDQGLSIEHPPISKADYHHRASRHLVQGHGYGGNLFGQSAPMSQQGYHGARVSREEGTTTHRRLSNSGFNNICLPVGQYARKVSQCVSGSLYLLSVIFIYIPCTHRFPCYSTVLLIVHQTMDYMTRIHTFLPMTLILLRERLIIRFDYLMKRTFRLR